jgi:hypothetical protein
VKRGYLEEVVFEPPANITEAGGDKIFINIKTIT